MNHKLLGTSAAASVIGRLDPDLLLDTTSAAVVVDCPPQSLVTLRSKGGGPAYLRITPRRIRYRAGDLYAWLEANRHRSTSEYMS